MDQQAPNQRSRELERIEQDHQRINGELRVEVSKLKERIRALEKEIEAADLKARLALDDDAGD